MESTKQGVLVVVKLQALACNITKSSTPPLNSKNNNKSRNASRI